MPDFESLGRIVRETWITWAQEQPDVADHPHWLVPWEELSERDKDVDRRIAAAVYKATRNMMFDKLSWFDAIDGNHSARQELADGRTCNIYRIDDGENALYALDIHVPQVASVFMTASDVIPMDELLASLDIPADTGWRSCLLSEHA